MEAGFFTQEKTCPGCGNKFQVLRIKSSVQRVSRRDTDFCVIYEGENPIMYGVFVCPKCNFAGADKEFNQPLTDFQLARLQKGLLLLRGEEPDFSGQRTWQVALRGYELAIRSAQIFQAKANYMASLFLKAAWCCRFAGLKENELEFIGEAAKYYQQVYEHETKDLKMSEPRLLYLIGELYRRARKINEAIKWFSRSVSNPAAKQEPEIERLARDQWLQAKADLKEAQELAELNGEQFFDEEVSPVQPSEAMESAKEQANESESTVAKPKVKRTKVSMNTQIYQEQYEWLKLLSNQAYDKHHQVLEKNEIVRAALDALSGVDIPPEHLENEDTLRAFFQALIKELDA